MIQEKIDKMIEQQANEEVRKIIRVMAKDLLESAKKVGVSGLMPAELAAYLVEAGSLAAEMKCHNFRKQAQMSSEGRIANLKAKEMDRRAAKLVAQMGAMI